MNGPGDLLDKMRQGPGEWTAPKPLATPESVERLAAIIHDAANNARDELEYYPDYCSWPMAMAAAYAALAAMPDRAEIIEKVVDLAIERIEDRVLGIPEEGLTKC